MFTSLDYLILKFYNLLLYVLFQLVQQPRRDTLVHGGSANFYYTVEKDAAKGFPGFNQCVSSF